MTKSLDFEIDTLMGSDLWSRGKCILCVGPMKRIIQPLLLEMEAISSPFIPRLAL